MHRSEQLNVGFAAGDWLRWLGGVNYYRALLSAVVDDQDRTIDPILFLGRGRQASLPGGFPSVEEVRSAIFDRNSPQWLARAASRRLLSRDPLFDRLLDAHDVRVVSHLNAPWRTGLRALMGWIPDLQHFRIPENFSAADHRLRDRQFHRIIEMSTFVIVSSEASRRDLLEYSEAAAGKARVLHFVPNIPQVDKTPAREELLHSHGVPGDYFHLPNQFWSHKNHELVVEALAVLNARGRRATVVATGTTTGTSGDPSHHDALMRKVRELGLEERFLSLGVVPFDEMIGLMNGSLAVVNPSRFEGWSTTVEEAKCLGKRVLCSDLAVHREQDPPGALFFDPDDAEGLADAMAETIDAGPAADSWAVEALASAKKRRLAFARRFSDIAHEAHDRLRDSNDAAG